MADRVDLNADLGESFGDWTMGDDDAILQIVTSANVACGFHGGDPLVMRDTIAKAKAGGVRIGAHPGYRDLWGFGRRPLPGEKPEDMVAHCLYQIGAIQTMSRAAQHPITHVKAHGALSNRAMKDLAMAEAIGCAAKAADPSLTWVVMPNTCLEEAAKTLGLPMVQEGFADRTYQPDGTLTPRSRSDAMIHDPDAAADQVLRMVQDGVVIAVDGSKVPLPVETICVHGDGPSAIKMAETLRNRLEAEGIEVTAFR